jgi:cytochrome o ubiquinol oxidase subunit II
MRYVAPAFVLISAATLGDCSEGVLDPKGPIAFAERQILFNSLGIMLATVIPRFSLPLASPFGFAPLTGAPSTRRISPIQAASR